MDESFTQSLIHASSADEFLAIIDRAESKKDVMVKVETKPANGFQVLALRDPQQMTDGIRNT